MSKVSELIKRWSEISIQLENLEKTKKNLLVEQMSLTEQLVKLSDNLVENNVKPKKSKMSNKSEKQEKAKVVEKKVVKKGKKPVMKASETSDSDTSVDSD